MGYGPIVNGKQMPITPWLGSWAQQEEERRKNPPPAGGQWPIGQPPSLDAKGRKMP